MVLVLSVAATAAERRSRALAPAEQRVAEIASLLPATPHGVGKPIDDRHAWDAIAQAPGFEEVVRNAERLRDAPMPELTDDLYLDFSKTGNRTRCQGVLSRRHGRVTQLALAECLENKGRFLPALEQAICDVCREKTWVQPASDGSLRNFRGETIEIDLAVAGFSWELATAYDWLGQRLSPGRSHIDSNGAGAPDAAAVRECRAEGGAAFMVDYHDEQLERRLPGRRDGHGLGHDRVAAAARRSLSRLPKRTSAISSAALRPTATAPRAWAIGTTVSGTSSIWRRRSSRRPAESSIGWRRRASSRSPDSASAWRFCPASIRRSPIATWAAGPDLRCMAYLSRRFHMGLKEWNVRGSVWGPVPPVRYSYWDCWAFPIRPPRHQRKGSAPELTLRDWFADAGILICRPAPKVLAAWESALKGGHNAEHHNHNDVGSFVVALGDATPLLDPGSEVYTARTFSSRRYESKVLNSFGHPVPRVAGQLQRPGRDAQARVIETSFTDATDTFVQDLRSAYAVPGLKQLQRTFIYSRQSTGSLQVIDQVEFESPQDFGIALITFSKWNKDSADRLLIGEGPRAVTVQIAMQGGQFQVKAEEIHEDLPEGEIPIRLGIDATEPVKSAQICLTITPQMP